MSVRRIVARDNAANQLAETSASARLVVVGNHSGRGFAGVLLGSVSAALMLLAHL